MPSVAPGPPPASSTARTPDVATPGAPSAGPTTTAPAFDPRASVERAYERIAADGRPGIWIDLLDRSDALAAADAVAERLASGIDQPLAGRTLAVKGNIDVRGLRTTAGCPTYGTVAGSSAAVVRHLEAAGVVVIGTTNLDQFATGLVGTRSPYGAAPNAHWPRLVSGGSSSGSAVAVAAGHVDLALGTDTAGSGRVPAGCNGIVGVKPTKGRLSTSGVVPACHSLDCVSVFARSVREAVLAADLASGPDPLDPWSREPAPAEPALADRLRSGRPVRVGRPRDEDLVLDGAVTPARFDAALDTFAATVGAEVVEVDLRPFVEAGRLLYDGAFVAERYAAVGAFVESDPGGLDPVVRDIVLAAGRLPAWRLAQDRTALERLRQRGAPAWQDVDVLVVPTAVRVPTREEVEADPVGVNTELGRYTNFVNLLDLCGITLPVGDPLPDHPPVSLTLLAPAWSDGALASLASSVV